MANEIYYSPTLADLRVAEVLRQELIMLLADRASLRGHPAITYLGDLSNRGSATIKVSQVGLDGYDVMGSVAENASVSNTALTVASATCTIARYAKQYEYSDLARLTDSLGELSAMLLAQDAVKSADMTFTATLCAILDNFGTSVGTSGAAMTLDNFYDAIYGLERAYVDGPFLSVLHPKQYTHFQSSLRAEAGAIQFMAATADQLHIKGQGFKGTFAGVDIFASSKVVTMNGGADRAGCMMGPGAVGWADAAAPVPQGAESVSAGPILLEFERNGSGGLTKAISNFFFGVTEIEDSRGVSIITANT